jgi:hypothetical protein
MKTSEFIAKFTEAQKIITHTNWDKACELAAYAIILIPEIAKALGIETLSKPVVEKPKTQAQK